LSSLLLAACGLALGEFRRMHLTAPGHLLLDPAVQLLVMVSYPHNPTLSPCYLTPDPIVVRVANYPDHLTNTFS